MPLKLRTAEQYARPGQIKNNPFFSLRGLAFAATRETSRDWIHNKKNWISRSEKRRTDERRERQRTGGSTLSASERI